MDSVSPVLTEEYVELEKVIALDQPEYAPIIILPLSFSDGTIAAAVRFRFSSEERQAIANGADLLITELTFGKPYTPLNLAVCKPESNPFS